MDKKKTSQELAPEILTLKQKLDRIAEQTGGRTRPDDDKNEEQRMGRMKNDR